MNLPQDGANICWGKCCYDGVGAARELVMS